MITRLTKQDDKKNVPCFVISEDTLQSNKFWRFQGATVISY